MQEDLWKNRARKLKLKQGNRIHGKHNEITIAILTKPATEAHRLSAETNGVTTMRCITRSASNPFTSVIKRLRKIVWRKTPKSNRCNRSKLSILTIVSGQAHQNCCYVCVPTNRKICQVDTMLLDLHGGKSTPSKVFKSVKIQKGFYSTIIFLDDSERSTLAHRVSTVLQSYLQPPSALHVTSFPNCHEACNMKYGELLQCFPRYLRVSLKIYLKSC